MHKHSIRFRQVNSIQHDNGEWACLCGNDASWDGFFPCDETGREVEPTPVDWRTDLYICARCNRLIDVNTAEIRGIGRFMALGSSEVIGNVYQDRGLLNNQAA